MGNRPVPAVGDEVRVFDVNGRRKGQPEGGWPGTVIKVGRQLVTIQFDTKTQQFRIDTRAANDGYEHQSFKTPDEARLNQRRDVALRVLRARGVRLASDHDLTTVEVEALAAVLAPAGDAVPLSDVRANLLRLFMESDWLPIAVNPNPDDLARSVRLAAVNVVESALRGEED